MVTDINNGVLVSCWTHFTCLSDVYTWFWIDKCYTDRIWRSPRRLHVFWIIEFLKQAVYKYNQDSWLALLTPAGLSPVNTVNTWNSSSAHGTLICCCVWSVYVSAYTVWLAVQGSAPYCGGERKKNKSDRNSLGLLAGVTETYSTGAVWTGRLMFE